MLDLVGSLVLGSTIAVDMFAVIAALSLGRGAQLAVAAGAGAWVAFIAAITAAGWLERAITVPAAFTVPLLLAVVFAFGSPSFRAALLAIPATLIIRLNVLRVLGGLFLLLAAAGRLSGPFPYSAGIGDLLTGIFALSVAGVAARTSVNNLRVLAWNAFGMLDLIAAVTLGVLSRNGTPLHLIHAGVGSAAIETLPWSLVPLVLVPVYLIGHALVFAHAHWSLDTRQQGYASSMT